MSFCPLLSTADKKVACQEECKWCLVQNSNGELVCTVSELYDLLDKVSGNVNYIADEVPRIGRKI